MHEFAYNSLYHNIHCIYFCIHQSIRLTETILAKFYQYFSTLPAKIRNYKKQRLTLTFLLKNLDGLMENTPIYVTYILIHEYINNIKIWHYV